MDCAYAHLQSEQKDDYNTKIQVHNITNIKAKINEVTQKKIR